MEDPKREVVDNNNRVEILERLLKASDFLVETANNCIFAGRTTVHETTSRDHEIIGRRAKKSGQPREKTCSDSRVK